MSLVTQRALRLTTLTEVSLGVAPQVISLVSFIPVSLVQCPVVCFRLVISLGTYSNANYEYFGKKESLGNGARIESKYAYLMIMEESSRNI